MWCVKHCSCIATFDVSDENPTFGGISVHITHHGIIYQKFPMLFEGEHQHNFVDCRIGRRLGSYLIVTAIFARSKYCCVETKSVNLISPTMMFFSSDDVSLGTPAV